MQIKLKHIILTSTNKLHNVSINTSLNKNSEFNEFFIDSFVDFDNITICKNNFKLVGTKC